MPKQSKKKPTRKFIPHKAVCTIVGAWINQDGKVVDEIEVGRKVLYEPDFENLREHVTESWPEVEKVVKGEADGK